MSNRMNVAFCPKSVLYLHESSSGEQRVSVVHFSCMQLSYHIGTYLISTR